MRSGSVVVLHHMTCNMNCVKLSFLHHVLTRGDCWMKHCVFSLRKSHYFSFHRTHHSNNKVVQLLSLSCPRRQIQSCKFESTDEGDNEQKTSFSLQEERVSQKTQKDVMRVSQKTQKDVMRVSQKTQKDVMRVSQKTQKDVMRVSQKTQKEVIRVALKTQKDVISRFNKVSSNEDRTRGNVFYHVAACHSMPQTEASPGRCSHPASVLCREHVFRTFSLWASSSSALHPSPAMSYSYCSSLGLKTTVRFYRGQPRPHVSHKSTRSNRGSEENSGSVHKDSDGLSDNEDEAKYDLSVARKEADQVSLKDLDDLDETTEFSDTEGQETGLIKRKLADEMTLPELSRSSFNIVPYVKRSVTLQNLVRLGVDLSKVEKVNGVAEHLIKADFDRHIVPFLKFLVQVGVEAKMIGHIFTANPLLFLENVQDLELRIGYLLHKKFTLCEIAAIITGSPVTLLMDPLMLDEKLAFLQSVFHLKDNQVREVVKKYPKILPWKKDLIADVKFHVKEFMGFTDTDIIQLILRDPQIFMSSKSSMVSRFDYLYNHMMISHQQILTWPTILRTRIYITKNRHLFLLYLDRAQYDPCKENFVSLKALAEGTDEEFCQKVAKCPVEMFYDFCKTL